MQEGSAEIDRHGQRVLRLLAKGRATIQTAGAATLLEVDGFGTISVPVGTLEALDRHRLVVRDEDGARLSSDADAMLRRQAAPSNDFAAQHRDMATVEIEDRGERLRVDVNLAESPLGGLARRKDRNGRPFLDAAELTAGERLRADYERAQLRPRMGANWQAAVASGRRDGGRGGIAELSDAAIDARGRVDAALAAVGPELSGVLVDVCCFLKGLETVEAERGWPVRSAKLILKCALGVLSRHYEPARQSRRRPSILHWGGEGYRPRMPG